MVLSPAPVQLCAVHLFAGRSRIAGRDDRIVLIYNDRAKVPPEAGSLVSAPQGKVEEILVTVGSHLQVFWETG